jgi:nitrate/nitrite transport system ATP-binding protein
LQDEIERIGRTTGKTIVFVTNDVDEAILIADRIVPLSAGPRATLGASVAVDIARPRNRIDLNHDPYFRRIRAGLIEYLLGTKQKRVTAVESSVQAPLVAAVESSV